jgi:hypothetical protein
MPELNAWLKLYHSANPVVRKRVWEALLRRDDPELCPWFLDRLDEEAEKPPYVRRWGPVADWLVRHQCSGLRDAMLRQVEHASGTTRAGACRVLGELGDPIALWPVIQALSDSVRSVHHEAAIALAWLLARVPDPASKLAQLLTAHAADGVAVDGDVAAIRQDLARAVSASTLSSVLLQTSGALGLDGRVDAHVPAGAAARGGPLLLVMVGTNVPVAVNAVDRMYGAVPERNGSTPPTGPLSVCYRFPWGRLWFGCARSGDELTLVVASMTV